MTEREKVIKGLECCLGDTRADLPNLCTICPYAHGNYATQTCGKKLRDDALALLKAKEPVEPIENAGFYYCGACRYAFTSARQKYCSECGRAVKWE